MVKSLGVQYVLVGHSERRVLFKEDDDVVNAKLRAVLDAGLWPILCIGESKAEYEAGLARDVCAAQLRGGLKGVTGKEMERVVIAYEPVWAIGTGLTATPAIAQSVHAYIRSVLAELHGPEVASGVRIQVRTAHMCVGGGGAMAAACADPFGWLAFACCIAASSTVGCFRD